MTGHQCMNSTVVLYRCHSVHQCTHAECTMLSVSCMFLCPVSCYLL